MKKVLVTLIAVGCAVSVFAQGTVHFNNATTGVNAPVYGVDPANQFTPKQGNTATGNPVGTTVYAGTPISGTGFTAQLLAGPLGTPEDALVPIPTTTTFRTTTGTQGGRVTAISSLVVPNVPAGQRATLQMRAWDNRGGTVTSWDQVLSDNSVARGWSLAFSPAGGLGDPTASPPTTPLNLVGLTSFQLFVVPEPSIIALGALGLGALILFRRRK